MAALTIEDTLLPVPFGSDAAANQLISIEEGVGKMNAALSARHDRRLGIVGRTSALAIAGIGEAVCRVRAYSQAGVDAIFLVGVRTLEELEELAAATPLPLILGSGEPTGMDSRSLARAGVRICLQGHLPFSAAIRAVHDTLKALRDGVLPKDVRNVSPDDLLRRATRADSYARWSEEFLRPNGAGVAPGQVPMPSSEELRPHMR